MKKYFLVLAFLVSCGGSSGGGDVDTSVAGETPAGDSLELLSTFSLNEAYSDCDTEISDMNLSLFYNEDESFVRILDSNDDLFLEGEYSSNFTVSSETEINGEAADCLTEITDGDCDEVPAGYECFDDMLYQRCESGSFECNIYWDFD